MSAGAGAVRTLTAGLTPQFSLEPLAPWFRAALQAGLAECAASGIDAMVYETLRTQALQAHYYQRGRPPTVEFPRPVTYQRDALRAWHIYGLAADIISRRDRWFGVNPATLQGLTAEARRDVLAARARQAEAWFGRMAAILAPHGLAWGGDWKQRDLPHVQWGRCRPSPSELSRTAYLRAEAAARARGSDPGTAAAAGRAAVWVLVRAA